MAVWEGLNVNWAISHSWIFPLCFTLVITMIAASIMPSFGDSGPDGAAEFSILVMLWLAFNLAAWVIWGILEMIF